MLIDVKHAGEAILLSEKILEKNHEFSYIWYLPAKAKAHKKSFEEAEKQIKTRCFTILKTETTGD